MNKVDRNQLEALTKLVISCMQNEQEKGSGYLVPVGVSNRHIHLSQEHVEAYLVLVISSPRKKN